MKFGPEERAAIYNASLLGISVHQLAREWVCSRSTIRNIIERESGEKPRVYKIRADFSVPLEVPIGPFPLQPLFDGFIRQRVATRRTV